jgi:1,4-alpha-glucan branching enzyme
MRVRGNGYWEIFVPARAPATNYKYEIVGGDGQLLPLKADPVAFAAEQRPSTASIVVDAERLPQPVRLEHHANALSAPMSIYEVHLGSWRRNPNEGSRWLTYRELAKELPDYAADMGFTHIELMPVSEHPFDVSWGYQPTGLFAPTSRFGPPEDFALLIDACHRKGPAYCSTVARVFPDDPWAWAVRRHGAYEHANPMQAAISTGGR